MKTWLIVWNALCLPFVFWFWTLEAAPEIQGNSKWLYAAIMTPFAIFIVSVPGILMFHGFNHLRYSLRNQRHQSQG
jgi:hypothetical protein